MPEATVGAPARVRKTAQPAVSVAVIGAGGIASRHAANIATIPGARIIAVADVSLERAQEQASRVGAQAHAFGDWRAMLESTRPDAALVCVPPFAHGDPELALSELGIPFFVEKPIATDLETAARVAAAVAKRGLVTAVGYHWRYLDIVERARELLAERPAHLAMGYWIDSVPPRDWWIREHMSGGQIVEQATHILDVARHLVGEIEAISALEMRAARRDPHGGDIPDAYAATARFASGAIGSFASASLTRWPHRIGLHLVCEAMVLELSEFELMIDVGQGRPVTRATGDPFVAEMTDFLAAVGGGANHVRVPYAEALKTHAVAVTAANSARQGGPLLRVESAYT